MLTRLYLKNKTSVQSPPPPPPGSVTLSLYSARQDSFRSRDDVDRTLSAVESSVIFFLLAVPLEFLGDLCQEWIFAYLFPGKRLSVSCPRLVDNFAILVIIYTSQISAALRASQTIVLECSVFFYTFTLHKVANTQLLKSELEHIVCVNANLFYSLAFSVSLWILL